MLLGFAIARGEIPSVDAILAEVAPGILPEGATPGAGAIAMEDLGTLRARHERASGPNYGAWVSSPNWLAYTLNRPMIAEPGGRMLYSTGSTHILGTALVEATGQSLLTQARRSIGDPLGIEIPAWTRDPLGYDLGGNEMALRPTAMLKIATLARDDGRFGGAQAIPTVALVGVGLWVRVVSVRVGLCAGAEMAVRSLRRLRDAGWRWRSRRTRHCQRDLAGILAI